MNRFAAYGGWGAEQDGEQTGEVNEQIGCIKNQQIIKTSFLLKL